MGINLRSLATGSAATRFMNCPGSVSMCQSIGEAKKSYATAGDEAHALAAKVLRGEILYADFEKIEDHAVRAYVDYVKQNSSGTLWIENRLPLLGSSGQLDAWSENITGSAADIFDFKYGVGVPLQAYENEQLAFYACALKEECPNLKSITCHLIQPRVESEELFSEGDSNITTWTLPYQTIAKWKRKIAAALDRVEEAKELKAGSWCQFCKAKAGCPAHLAYAESTAVAQADYPSELIPMPGSAWLPDSVERLARVYRMKSQMTAWFNKAEEFLFNLGISGHEDIIKQYGFHIGKKQSSRKWKDGEHMMSEEDIAKALESRGVPSAYNKKLIGVTKAEEYCNIDDLVYKPEGGLALRGLK